MKMDILLHELLISETGHFRMCLNILICNLSRLLHHISKVTCHGKSTFALADRTLDEQNLATHRSPGKTCHDSRTFITLLDIMRVGRESKIFLQVRRLDGLRIFLLKSDLLCCHTSDFCNPFFKAADT